VSVTDLRRECAEKRDLYQHAKNVYGAAVRLGLSARIDLSALRGELEVALVSYYAAHSALHSALRPRAGTGRLH